MPLYYRKNPDIIFFDSFEFSGTWNGTIDLSGALSGSSNFTTPSVFDGFEFSDIWNGTSNLLTAISGSSTFTTASVSDGFEPSDGWI